MGCDEDKVCGHALKVIEYFVVKLAEDEDDDENKDDDNEEDDDDLDEDDDEKDVDVDKKLAHLSLVRCGIMLDKCDNILRLNGLDGTFMDTLLIATEGIRGTYCAAENTDGIEMGEDLEDIPSMSTACLYGAVRVGNDLVSYFGPGAMVMLSLIYALLEWVVDLSHVDEGKK